MIILLARLRAIIFASLLIAASHSGVVAEQVDFAFWDLGHARSDLPGAATGIAQTTSRADPGGRENIARIIDRQARAEGVPAALAHAVVTVESRYNPQARGGAGEVGLMQIKPQTARGMGYRGNTSALYDPATNVKWGMKYLGEAYRLAGGDVCGTILRYNAGHGARRMNPISARYCAKVRRILRDRNGIRSARL